MARRSSSAAMKATAERRRCPNCGKGNGLVSRCIGGRLTEESIALLPASEFWCRWCGAGPYPEARELSMERRALLQAREDLAEAETALDRGDVAEAVRYLLHLFDGILKTAQEEAAQEEAAADQGTTFPAPDRPEGFRRI